MKNLFMGLIVVLLAVILFIVAMVAFEAYKVKRDVDNVRQKVEQPLNTLKDGVQDAAKKGSDKLKEETNNWFEK